MAVPPSYQYLRLQHREEVTHFYAGEGSRKFPITAVFALIGLPVLALLVPCAFRLRLFLFAVTLYLSVIIIRDGRTVVGGNGFIVGLLTPLWVLRITVRTILSKPERDFSRLERNLQRLDRHDSSQLDTGEPVHWQPYPRKRLHRLSWVLGLLFTARGSAWNWRVDTLSSLPVELQYSKPHPRRRIRVFFNTPCHGLFSHVADALMSYMVFDIILFLMRMDPYFWGFLQAVPLAESPFHVFSQQPLILHGTRMLLGWLHTTHGVSLAHAVSVLPMRLIAQVAPGVARFLSPVPCDQPWLYAPLFGPKGPVLDSDFALADFWNGYWHQIFRLDILTCSNVALDYGPAWLRQNRVISRITRIFLSFSLVGVTHACASYTQIGSTEPIRRTLLFFLLQPIGIILHVAFHYCMPFMFRKYWLRRATNLSFILIWFYICSELIFDDYSVGGTWVFEWVPLSLAHFLFSSEDNRCWRWGSI
jgi:hypothetical protein